MSNLDFDLLVNSIPEILKPKTVDPIWVVLINSGFKSKINPNGSTTFEKDDGAVIVESFDHFTFISFWVNGSIFGTAVDEGYPETLERFELELAFLAGDVSER